MIGKIKGLIGNAFARNYYGILDKRYKGDWVIAAVTAAGSRQMVTVQKPVKEALYHDKKPIHAHA